MVFVPMAWDPASRGANPDHWCDKHAPGFVSDGSVAPNPDGMWANQPDTDDCSGSSSDWESSMGGFEEDVIFAGFDYCSGDTSVAGFSSSDEGDQLFTPVAAALHVAAAMPVSVAMPVSAAMPWGTIFSDLEPHAAVCVPAYDAGPSGERANPHVMVQRPTVQQLLSKAELLASAAAALIEAASRMGPLELESTPDAGQCHHVAGHMTARRPQPPQPQPQLPPQPLAPPPQAADFGPPAVVVTILGRQRSQCSRKVAKEEDTCCRFCHAHRNGDSQPRAEQASGEGGMLKRDSVLAAKTRDRRKQKQHRSVLRFAGWWASLGYSGESYCERCGEIFRDHQLRQKKNSAQCNRESPCDDCAKILAFFPSDREMIWRKVQQKEAAKAAKRKQAQATKRALEQPMDYLQHGEETRPHKTTKKAARRTGGLAALAAAGFAMIGLMVIFKTPNTEDAANRMRLTGSCSGPDDPSCFSCPDEELMPCKSPADPEAICMRWLIGNNPERFRSPGPNLNLETMRANRDAVAWIDETNGESYVFGGQSRVSQATFEAEQCEVDGPGCDGADWFGFRSDLHRLARHGDEGTTRKESLHQTMTDSVVVNPPIEFNHRRVLHKTDMVGLAGVNTTSNTMQLLAPALVVESMHTGQATELREHTINAKATAKHSEDGAWQRVPAKIQPPARAGAVAWADGLGTAYVFGGSCALVLGMSDCWAFRMRQLDSPVDHRGEQDDSGNGWVHVGGSAERPPPMPPLKGLSEHAQLAAIDALYSQTVGNCRTTDMLHNDVPTAVAEQICREADGRAIGRTWPTGRTHATATVVVGERHENARVGYMFGGVTAANFHVESWHAVLQSTVSIPLSMNDLWRFDVDGYGGNVSWTWIPMPLTSSGRSLAQKADYRSDSTRAVYITNVGVAPDSQSGTELESFLWPSSRYRHAAWPGPDGSLFVFGGLGSTRDSRNPGAQLGGIGPYGQNPGGYMSELSDLWEMRRIGPGGIMMVLGRFKMHAAADHLGPACWWLLSSARFTPPQTLEVFPSSEYVWSLSGWNSLLQSGRYMGGRSSNGTKPWLLEAAVSYTEGGDASDMTWDEFAARAGPADAAWPPPRSGAMSWSANGSAWVFGGASSLLLSTTQLGDSLLSSDLRSRARFARAFLGDLWRFDMTVTEGADGVVRPRGTGDCPHVSRVISHQQSPPGSTRMGPPAPSGRAFAASWQLPGVRDRESFSWIAAAWGGMGPGQVSSHKFGSVPPSQIGDNARLAATLGGQGRADPKSGATGLADYAVTLPAGGMVLDDVVVREAARAETVDRQTIDMKPAC